MQIQNSNELLASLESKFGSKQAIIQKALSNDGDLLAFLLENDELKSRFFAQINAALVFKKDEFLDFLKLRILDASYTKFQNKIGLFADENFLKNSGEVVLNFAYKDCVLKGAQSKDSEKENEIFFNEILAKDEIDVLFEPKALQNFELVGVGNSSSGNHFADLAIFADGDELKHSIPTAKIAKNNESEASNTRIDFKDDLNSAAAESNQIKSNQIGRLKDSLKSHANFLIKGNNLLALHSLKKRKDIYGKVKLIYIDPPYNTQSAANTFSYNNNFNHSSWLTFMSNRAQIASKFLQEDGFFVCSIDHCELFYLGVLLDEIFGRDNRVGIVSVETNPRGRADSEFLATSNEFFLIYAKNISKAKINDLPMDEQLLKDYKLEDKFSKYKLIPLKRTGSNSTPDKRPNLYFPIYYNPQENKISVEPMENSVEILPNGVNEVKVWRWGKEKIMNSLTELEAKKVNGNEYSIFVKDRIKFTKKAKTFWSNPKYDAATSGTQYLQKFNLTSMFSYPKSIFLMEDIIKLFTNDNDLIMDYHAGSGTTAEAIINLNRRENTNRRFILIEQMDYVESITKARLEKVIEGEQGGVSKAVGFSGGGSFIYAELMGLNASFREKIHGAKNDSDLSKIYKTIAQKAFIDYRVDIKAMLNDKDFEALEFNEKREILCAILDKNMDYVLYGDIEDESYGISSEIIALNRAFYGE